MSIFRQWDPSKQMRDYFFNTKILPHKGSIIKTDLIFGYDHTGIYVGDNKIVELNGDQGDILCVDSNFFAGGAYKNIFIACDVKINVLYDENIMYRALEMVGKRRKYQVLFNNCHQFTSGCITNEFENSDKFLWMLEMTIRQRLNKGKAITWACWEKEDGDNANCNLSQSKIEAQSIIRPSIELLDKSTRILQQIEKVVIQKV